MKRATLEDPDLEPYFKLGVSVTNVLYAYKDQQLQVFIQKITKNPYAGAWSLPGALIEPHMGLEEASAQLAYEAIGNSEVYLEQLNAFGKTYRHPLGRVIDVAFYGLINIESDVKSYPEQKEFKWVAHDEVPQLAFDHNEILELSIQRLRRRLVNRPIGFKLLPPEFTLAELQGLYEQILGYAMDKRNFRKKLTKLNILTPKGHDASDQPGRKPRLYSFNESNYTSYLEKGF